MDPTAYEAWYHTSRGTWIGATEFHLLMKMLKPLQGATLLDVGCGTSYFTRRFSDKGIEVIGLDPDESMLAYARSLGNDIRYLEGNALAIPLADHSVDYCAAVTSLCFVDKPQQALQEMLRVSRRGITVGLLNRDSRLYKQKYGRGAYQGARWDTVNDVKNWLANISNNTKIEYGSAVFFPGGNPLARVAEIILPHRLLWGSFLVVTLHKNV